MNTARIARGLALTTSLMALSMLFAGAAGAKTLSRPFSMDTNSVAVDGTDIYWTAERKVGKDAYDTVLYRGSFLNRSKVELARYKGTDLEQFSGLAAGGGYVAVSLNREIYGGSSKSSEPTTKVIRYARDGSQRTVLATGRIHTSTFGNYILKHGIAYLDDCGTRVKAFAVSSTGSVVVGRAVSDRRSKPCGRKKDVDHWRYYEQRLDGSQREILSKDAAVKSKYKAVKHGWIWRTTSGDPAFLNVQIRGDRVIFQSAASIQTYVRDAATGAFSGPFDLTPNVPEKYSQSSLSDAGAVALTTYGYSKKVGLTINSGIFPSAANPTLYTQSKSKKARELLFCGNHLLSTPIYSRKLQELDPVTFAPIRTLATLKKDQYIVSGNEFGCNNNYVYGLGFNKNFDGTLLAIPLN